MNYPEPDKTYVPRHESLTPEEAIIKFRKIDEDNRRLRYEVEMDAHRVRMTAFYVLCGCVFVVFVVMPFLLWLKG